MDERIAVSRREEHRVHVIRLSLEQRLTVREAAQLRGLSARQGLRLRQRLAERGRGGSLPPGAPRCGSAAMPQAAADDRMTAR